jgi:hypothetical protein
MYSREVSKIDEASSQQEKSPFFKQLLAESGEYACDKSIEMPSFIIPAVTTKALSASQLMEKAK